MRVFLNSLLTVLVCLGISSTVGWAALTEIDKQEDPSVNLVDNPGYENGLARWTNTGGGTLAAVTAGANLGIGTTSASWDASAVSDSLTSKQITLPSGLYGQACKLQYLQKGGDTNLIVQVWDGSTVIASQPLVAQTAWTEVSQVFTCPSSGTIGLRFLAVSNAAIMYVDRVFVGLPSSGTSVAALSPVAYELAKQQIGAVGSAGQVKQGHILTDASFPTFTTEVSYYNLSSVSDGSANARSLTNNGTTVFTGTDILGTASSVSVYNGTTQYLSSTDAFFDPGDVNFTMGGWFAADDWTPATNDRPLLCQGDRTSDFGFCLTLKTTGDIEIYGSNTGTAATSASYIPSEALVDTSWHHLAVTYVAATNTFSLYVDGLSTPTSVTLAGNQRLVTANTFRVGAGSGATGFYAGKAQGMFMVNGLALGNDNVRKLAAYKKSHNLAVSTGNQEWWAYWTKSDNAVQNVLDNGWIIDLTVNDIWWDLSGYSTTDSISLKMKNVEVHGKLVSPKTYQTGLLIAAPSFPLLHGLGARPAVVQVVTRGQSISGKDDYRQDLCSADDTEITCDLSSLTIDGSHPVNIVAGVTPLVSAVVNATATTAGIVTTTQLGYTKFVGNGAYATLAAALADSVAGDSILVYTGYSISSPETVSVSDVSITFMPNVQVTVTGGTGGLNITSDRVKLLRANYKSTFAGSLTYGVQVTGDNCWVKESQVRATGASVVITTGFNITAAADRAHLEGTTLVETSGTITNSYVNAGTGTVAAIN